MTKRRVWRYSCDHCKRATCSKSATARHEQGCCKNPNRVCGFCREGELVQKPMAELLESFGGDIDALRKAASGCPMCMLAAIVQSKLQYPPDEEGGGNYFSQFEFRKERDAFWADKNEEDRNSRSMSERY